MGADSEDTARARGFTIVDKRGSGGAEAATDEADAAPRAERLPPVDFASFLISLGTSALYHLGQLPDPQTGRAAAPDLPVARHTIDTLELIQTKTRGNLTEEEERLLTHLLTDLRMRFVEASRASSP
jgi:hypothetical protein